MELDLERYAQVAAELAAAGEARGSVLASHGLDEERWNAIDDRWQARFSRALDEEDDGVPALVARYAAAYESAQRSLAPPITLEQFANVTRLLQASGDLRAALAKVGVTLADYTRASEHWSRRLADDPELERTFDAALRRR